MSFKRTGLRPLLGGVVLLLASPAFAGNELDQCRTRVLSTHLLEVADSDLGLQTSQREQLGSRLNTMVPLAKLGNIEDFHPEVERWTDRNNRIRITAYTGVWLFSGELDIHTDVPIGFRINWEVPGFIGIRWDSGFLPWGRMEVKGQTTSGRSSRWMSGFAHTHNLSIGIFNPELSVSGLAFWAGFGLGLWFFDFQENDVFGVDSNVDAEYNNNSDLNIAGNIFVEFDYAISDTFHIGLGFRQFFVLAPQTDEGRFYNFNGVDQTIADGRNDGQFDDLAGITEITLNISVLF